MMKSAATFALIIAAAVVCTAGATTATRSPAVEPVAGSPPDDTALQELAVLYARYLTAGRSDVEIHLVAEGATPLARVRLRDDGSSTCEVTGLRLPERLQADDPRAARRWLAGLLVHEVTHCLVSPHVPAWPQDPDARRRQHLALEGMSDARAVIELFRRDGLDAAADYTASVVPWRRLAGPTHSTEPALLTALDLVRRDPASVAADGAALAQALRIGAVVAGIADLDDLAAVQAAVLRAFRDGRHDQAAATVRRRAAQTGPADRHLFVQADGRIEWRPVIGAEGAHSHQRLADLLAAGGPPAHQLAVRWLRREGLLAPDDLRLAQGAFGRLLAAYPAPTPADEPRRLAAVEAAVDRSRPGQGIDPVLEDAESALRALSR